MTPAKSSGLRLIRHTAHSASPVNMSATAAS